MFHNISSNSVKYVSPKNAKRYFDVCFCGKYIFKNEMGICELYKNFFKKNDTHIQICKGYLTDWEHK